jgi:serine/threonine protein phosphatase 1
MRTLVIGDIHGCLAAFDTLLRIVQPTTDDLLITLGDYVDRGPDSKGVINRLLFLHSRTKMISLMGNHEIMMIKSRDKKARFKEWLQFGGSETLESYREPNRHVSLQDVPESHWQFLEQTCGKYHELEKFICVHATLDHEVDLVEQNDEALFWDKLRPDQFVPHYSGKSIICGHTVQKSGEILQIPGAICIDTWAYGDGWLTCLEPNTGQYWQANELGETREGELS